MKHTNRFLCALLILTLVLGLFFTDIPALRASAVSEAEIPAFTDGTATHGSEAHDAGPTPDGNNNYQLTYSGVTAAEVQSYEQKLRSAGFTLYDEREIKNGSYTNRFATYVGSSDIMVHINYFPALSRNQFQIIYGSAKYLIPTTKTGDYEAVVTPSVSIIERTDGVLCMVVQLADGSYVVIDGGYGYSMTSNYTIPNKKAHRDGSGITYTYKRDHKKDMATLLAFLQDTNRDGKVDSKDTRPQVTWMATHGDPDHVQLAYVFMQTYHSKFDLNTIIYNFPNFYNIGLYSSYDPDDLTKKSKTGFMGYAQTYFPNAKHYIYHTGQILDLPGCQIEFLYSQEDYFPYKMTSPNHTCGIWRFNFVGGKSLLITGDAEEETNEQAAKVLGSYLQSDMMQVIHHGSNGGTSVFYNAVDPDICFWPCLDTSFYHDKRHLGTYSGYSFNKVLRNGQRTHYTASNTHTVFVPTLSYNANGGKGSIDPVTGLYCGVTAKEGTSPTFRVTLAANGFTGPDNKTFLGWSTSPSGPVEYAPGAALDLTSSLELYAVWEAEGYTVTFMDGNTVLKTETVKHGSDATAPALPEKSGYTAAWDNDGKNITADTTIRVVYTPVVTEEPTEESTEESTEEPTEEPTEAPTEASTEEPTEVPTETSTEESTQAVTTDGSTAGSETTAENGQNDANDASDSAIITILIIVLVAILVSVAAVILIKKRKRSEQ